VSSNQTDSATTTAAIPVQFRLVTRYATRSAEAADENQRRVEGVFAELAAARPDNVSYLVLRLADGSFVHISFHGHGPGDTNPIASLASFAHFQDGHDQRRDGGVDQQQATVVGAYLTNIS
jgi:tRNA (Thr-GGU) A37 N-methylase